MIRRRLAVLLSGAASRLLELANRLDPETVQLVEELADLAEPEVGADEVVALAETRDIAIGLAMRDLKPGEPVIVHRGGQGCTGKDGCDCGAVAYRADRGQA